MKNKTPKIKIGDVVRVKAGVTDPDDPSIDWGGWHGRVLEMEPAGQKPRSILIALDSITLRSLPTGYIEQSAEMGLNWSQLYLDLEDVVRAAPRDTPKEAKDVAAELALQHRWAYLGEEGQDIQAILGESVMADDWEQMKTWGAYLEAHLKFPFNAKVTEWQMRGPLRTGDRLRVLSIEDVDELYGVIVKCRRKWRNLYAPLADLEVLDSASPNHQLVQDYSVWFANR